jgi:hypothetical protein
MAFCPECGKPTTPEASKCVGCGHELEAKPAGVKTGAARFKGTMLMATSPVVTKAAENKPAAKPAAAAPAAAPVASPAAGVGAGKPQAKSTIIGTGLGAAAAGANAARPANQVVPAAAPTAAKPAAAPIARAAAPNAGGSIPKSTVIGAGVAPLAAAAAAHAAKPAAAAPIAAAAAGAVAQASAARTTNQGGATKPDDSKRNIAYAQTQHQGAFAATSQAAIASGSAAGPRTSPNIGVGVATAAAEAFDPHAETDPPPDAPNAIAVDELAAEAANDQERDPLPDTKYLPGDPMAPQTQPAPRAPMLRYDDSIPRMSRGGGQDKKWLWIAAGVIVLACLGLVFVLASRMGH